METATNENNKKSNKENNKENNKEINKETNKESTKENINVVPTAVSLPVLTFNRTQMKI
tara:strand:+ start:175 stop:351 length:177 start_codon:yes stop_codon:yes gene_type:complete